MSGWQGRLLLKLSYFPYFIRSHNQGLVIDLAVAPGARGTRGFVNVVVIKRVKLQVDGGPVPILIHMATLRAADNDFFGG